MTLYGVEMLSHLKIFMGTSFNINILPDKFFIGKS